MSPTTPRVRQVVLLQFAYEEVKRFVHRVAQRGVEPITERNAVEVIVSSCPTAASL